MPRPCPSRVQNRSFRKFRPGAHPRPRRLLVEPLEDRRLLADIIAHWQNGSGNWSDISHWDIGVVPNNVGGTTYTVVLDAPDQVLDVTVDLAVTISGLTNAETVQVAAGKTLTVSGPVANTGDLLAAGGTLRFTNSTVTNTGRTITADGGVVEVKDSTITGGVLRATDNAASYVQFAGDVTLNGVTWEDPGAGQFRIYGTTARLLGEAGIPSGHTLVVWSAGYTLAQLSLAGGSFRNDGRIEFYDQDSYPGIPQVYAEADVTLTGTGEWVLQSGNAKVTGTAGVTLTVGAEQTVHGQGQLSVAVVNQGSIVADQSGGSLTLGAAVSNQGTLRAAKRRDVGTGATVVIAAWPRSGRGWPHGSRPGRSWLMVAAWPERPQNRRGDDCGTSELLPQSATHWTRRGTHSGQRMTVAHVHVRNSCPGIHLAAIS